jgi:hypothetical protein
MVSKTEEKTCHLLTPRNQPRQGSYGHVFDTKFFIGNLLEAELQDCLPRPTSIFL